MCLSSYEVLFYFGAYMGLVEARSPFQSLGRIEKNWSPKDHLYDYTPDVLNPLMNQTNLFAKFEGKVVAKKPAGAAIEPVYYVQD
jgi:hypothetical protein